MVNPFKKRHQRKAAAAAQAHPSSPPPTDYASFPSTSKLPPRPGIFIASASPAPRISYNARQQRAAAAEASASQQQNLDHVLPPASDYRQSLIMPHLTRRFTLLRAPDGSLVSPDAMRAHLRAQRARARAANVAIGSGMAHHIHFLTEDEENEIIEQLKAQARAEGRDFDLEQSATAAALDSWRNGYAAGTDGFGSWGPTPTRNVNKLSSLAETLGAFSANHGNSSVSEDASSSAWSPSRNIGGSLFSGRSAERDEAYFRKAKMDRNNSKAEESRTFLKVGTAPESFQNAVPEALVANSQMLSQETTLSESNDDDEAPMPGGFNPVQVSEMPEPALAMQQNHGQVKQRILLGVPGLNDASRSRASQDSKLLTTLSPEAFKRVSTALDEVFGLIASERGPSPAMVDTKSQIDSNHKTQRSSVDSGANSFTSALSHARPSEATRAGSDVKGASSAQESEPDEVDDGDETADRTITGPQPSLNAVHIEEGRLALPSSLSESRPGSPKGTHSQVISNLPESQTATQFPSLVSSDSALTIMDSSRDVKQSQAGSLSLLEVAPPQHLSVSSRSLAESTHARPSDHSSTATATEVLPPASRFVSTASTVEGQELNRIEPPAAGKPTAPDSSVPPFHANEYTLDAASHLPAETDVERPIVQPDRTPDMIIHNFIASPTRSTLSRGNSVISTGSMRSSNPGPSASYQEGHSRKSSADKLALARSMAPHPILRERPSLSSVHRNFRQHVRSTTGSSESSLLGGHTSRRSSRAMSPPPMLSRSARSPNYFPPPASHASMHDYASGFKPPSAISPAAAAALHSMASQANQSPQPMQSSVMDASNALRSAQSTRNSVSTSQSAASPQVASFATFTSSNDRAAASSPAETGAPSFSHHQRDASLTNANQRLQMQSSRDLVAEDAFLPSMYAPRPAPVPVLASPLSPKVSVKPTINQNGLMPNAPSDPEKAERWRAVYGIKATDAASLRNSAEDVSADPNEDDDVWARMASTSEQTDAQRPVSNLPPNVAERLAGTGITFDQIADFQDRLIQTATSGTPLPPIQDDDNIQQRNFAEAKLKGLASPNIVIGSGSEWTKPAASAQTGDGLAFAGSSGKSIDIKRDASLRRVPSTAFSHDPPHSPRAVMYDVTTSHRPTSPPLHSRNGSLNGLPSLLELNGSSFGHRTRESFSLSQVVDKASRMPRHPAFRSPSIAEDGDSTNDQDSQFALANAVQEHPFNAGYTSPSFSSGTGFSFPRKLSQPDLSLTPRGHAQPQPPEDIWNQYGPQQGGMTSDVFAASSPGSPLTYLGADPTRLLDDVAAQTSAATRALKGTDDGTVPTPPFRTKSMSRKKSLKKVAKHISSPQLISTTQKLDYATQIAPPLDTLSAMSKFNKSSIRSPVWGSIGNMGMDGSRSHSKASPSGASPSGSVSKNSGYFHRRRSSSFGHEATPNGSMGLHNGGVDSAPVSAEQKATHPNHPYLNGGASGGSLSRLFSKIKSRKNADQAYGGATIEPFPAELSVTARDAAESLFQQPAPTPPEIPTLPPVERSAPWALPRMPSSTSSDRGSSVRSPTSPVYTLPIDSTSMPRSKSKKKRTPIVLKRESEVIMPGDPGYIPTAIIGRSPEEHAKELANEPHLQPVRDADVSIEAANVAAAAPQMDMAEHAHQEVSTDTILERNAERMDYSQSGRLGVLAPVAAVDNNKPVTPRPASPLTTEQEKPKDGDVTIDGADTTLPATVPEVAKETQRDRAVDARKSLRDTIVRRTIIIPAGIDFSEHRRSLFASSRKSRRFAAAVDEPVPNTSIHAESPAVVDDAALPDDKQNETEGMPIFSSRQRLHPDASTAGGGSNRVSKVESSYAGSLYDMYISGEGIEFGSPGSETPELTRRSLVLNGSRASRMAETRRHIEITERADGSVVWQVIAGLADRGSVYSDFNPRHSRHASDASHNDEPDGGEETLSGLFRTPAGLTDDDSRSFFTRPRGHHKSCSVDKSEPLPDLPSHSLLGGNGVQQDVFEIANPNSGHSNIAHGSDHLASPENGVSAEKSASPTRIVYHNDAQLASLLNVLAKGKDSAKFEFQTGPTLGPSTGPEDGAHLVGAATEGFHTEGRPLSTWTQHEIFDADDIESHRSRVEAEIYTLLNQQALLSRWHPTPTSAAAGESEQLGQNTI